VAPYEPAAGVQALICNEETQEFKQTHNIARSYLCYSSARSQNNSAPLPHHGKKTPIFGEIEKN
jgi:hypothetical protein